MVGGLPERDANIEAGGTSFGYARHPHAQVQIQIAFSPHGDSRERVGRRALLHWGDSEAGAVTAEDEEWQVAAECVADGADGSGAR